MSFLYIIMMAHGKVHITRTVFYFVSSLVKLCQTFCHLTVLCCQRNIRVLELSVIHFFIHWTYVWHVAYSFGQLVGNLPDWIFVIVVWLLLCTAAVRVQYPGTTDAQISGSGWGTKGTRAEETSWRQSRSCLAPVGLRSSRWCWWWTIDWTELVKLQWLLGLVYLSVFTFWK